MTQRTIRNPLTGESPTGDKLTGNKAAKAALERAKDPVLLKISDLPDRKAKLHYVADMIEQQALVMKDIGFNMGHWKSNVPEWDGVKDRTGNSCGTVACIAGWTMLLEDGVERAEVGIERDAQKLLGLTSEEAQMLFLVQDEYGDDASYEMSDVTPQEAVKVIRYFADKGTVRWRKFLNPDNTSEETG